MKILFVLHAPDSGGAERQLHALLAGLDRSVATPHLALLFSGGDFAARFAAIEDLSVHHLSGRAAWTRAALPGAFLRLLRLARELRPDVVCAMLPVANEMAIIAGRLAGARTVTGVRCSALDWGRYGMLPALAYRTGAALSRLADLVLANSSAGRDHAVRSGYPADRIRVIPNGVDGAAFAPDKDAGARMRAAWGVGADDILVGQCGRLDPMKDFPNFLRAARVVREGRPRIRFVCLGRGKGAALAELQALSRSLGLEEAVLWPGYVDDMRGAYNALDLLCLGSADGEGFSNVLGEAMACGVPCVATDVGDAALILGPEGVVVPPGDPALLGAAMAGLLDEGAGALARRGGRCRERVVSLFSVERMVRSHEAQWTSLVREGRPCAE